MLSVNHLSFSYGGKNTLSDITFEAVEGTRIAVLGPNGAGKSTLFRCILGLLPQFTGEIKINEKKIRAMQQAELARCAAYIPQSSAVVFDYTVLEMVLMGTTGQLGPFSGPGKRQIAKAQEILQSLGIDTLGQRSFGKLSGGERQLTLIARAMVQGAKLLIMDEPTANLDFGNQQRVLMQMERLAKQGYTVLFSTHDPNQALSSADEALVLKEGRMLAYGAAEETLTAELLTELYGVEVSLETSQADPSRRICVPLKR